MNENYDATALLALPGIKEGSRPSAGLLLWSRPYLVEQIRSHGVDVNFSRGIGAFNTAENTVNNTIRPEYYENDGGTDVLMRKLGTTSLDYFGVIRNVIKQVDSDTTTPFLNPNNLRNLTRDKFDMAHMVLGVSGLYGRDFVSIGEDNTAEDVEYQINSLTGDQVVAKPITGRGSSGVIVGSKSEVIEALDSAEKDYLVEEKLDFSSPFPSIQGSGESEQSRLTQANLDGVNKELRLFYFGDNQWDGVARIAMPGELDFKDDKWLYIDQDSIPGSLIEYSSTIVSAIQRLVRPQDSEFNIAIDWVYASSASMPEPSWRVMEVNGVEPQLVQLSQNLEVGRRQHDKLATQISRIALR